MTIHSSLVSTALPNSNPNLSNHPLRKKSSAASIASNASTSGLPSAKDGEEVSIEGLPHSHIRLEARRYKTPAFAELLLDLVRDHLRLPTWTSAHLLPSDIHIFKVSGSLTNAVFFISSSTFSPSPRTLLLRIYGPSSSSLISRPSELRTLHALSSIYHMGPRIYGTFGNGRVEEYFESEALTAESMRDKKISRWIGRRMGELHHVDLSTVVAAEEWGDEDVAIKRNLGEWIAPAGAVLNTLASKLESYPQSHPLSTVISSINLPQFTREWSAYLTWLSSQRHSSKRVFAHNDAQYGNILLLKSPTAPSPAPLLAPSTLPSSTPNSLPIINGSSASGSQSHSTAPNGTQTHTPPPKPSPSHHAIIVLDFEYSAPNPAAYDIANHFHEWCANYHSLTSPHVLDPSKYPNEEERRNFYKGYLFPPGSPPSSSLGPKEKEERDKAMSELDKEVSYWSPASHAVWALWGLIQARDDVSNWDGIEEGIGGEFDYLGYAVGRMEGFRRELVERGICASSSGSKA